MFFEKLKYTDKEKLQKMKKNISFICVRLVTFLPGLSKLNNRLTLIMIILFEF